MRSATAVAVLLAALSLSLPRTTLAASVIAKDLPALCNQADLVFVGTVAKVTSEWADAEKKEIETLVTFTDVEPLLGTDSSDVTLRFGGGQLGDLRQEIGGLPHFAEKQRFVIFARSERSISPIVGFDQGCIRVVDGPSGPAVLSADWRPITDIKDGQLVYGSPDKGAAGAMTLGQFLDVVQHQLQQRR